MARSFDGTNDDLTAANVDLSGESVITVVYDAYETAFDNVDEALAELTVNGATNSGGFFLNPNGSGSTDYDVTMINGISELTNGDFPRPSAGAFHKFVIILSIGSNPNTIQVWVDGVSQTFTYANQSTSTGHTFANDTLYFGQRAGTSFPFNGRLQEFAIFSGALNAGQIAAHAAKYSPLLVGQPLYYWPFIGRTSPEPELIRGSTATVDGATAIAHNAVIYPAAPHAIFVPSVVGGATPKGPFGLPFYGPFGGPI